MSQPNFRMLDYKNVNRNKYEYLEPQRVTAKCLISSCVYNLDGNNKLPYYFESPKLRALTDIYKLGNEFKLDVVVPMGSQFMEYLIAEDEKNIRATVEHSMEWFGDQIPMELAQEKYKSSIIFRSGGEDPILRLNIPSFRGKPTIEVFSNKNVVEFSKIQPGCEIACILQKVGVKFQSETFAGELDCHKIKITQEPDYSKLPTGYYFRDGSEDEEEPEGEQYGNEEEDNESEDELAGLEVDLSEGEEGDSGEEDELAGLEVNLGGEGDELYGQEDELEDLESGGEEEELEEEHNGFAPEELTDEELELSEDESEEEPDELEADDLDLSEVSFNQEADLELGSDEDGEDLGLEELDLTGAGEEETESDVENELGLQELDLTPSRHSQKPTNGFMVEELDMDEFN